MTGSEDSASNHDRPRRSWRIPPKLFGRIRTSTVLLGLCFVLTGLLYNQLQEGNDGPTAGPTAVDPGVYQTTPRPQSQSTEEYQQTTTEPPVTSTEPSTTPVPGENSATPGAPGSTTGGTDSSSTQVPTYLPGLTVPPELRSLLPAPPSATATP